MRSALMLLADDPSLGVPALTDDPAAADALFSMALDKARQVPGVGRVLLFHPPHVETRLARQALGFRLWPQEGESPLERYTNAFRQALLLGYEGAVVMGVDVPTIPVDRVSHAAALLEDHHGAVVGDGHGGIALLALQEPQPTLFAGLTRPTYDQLRTRAAQQRLRLVELPEHEALTAETVDGFLSSSARR